MLKENFIKAELLQINIDTEAGDVSQEYLEMCKEYHLWFNVPSSSYRKTMENFKELAQHMSVKNKLPFQYGKTISNFWPSQLNENEKGIFVEIHSSKAVFYKMIGEKVIDMERLEIPLSDASANSTKEFEVVMKFLVYFANDKIEELTQVRNQLTTTLQLESGDTN